MLLNFARTVFIKHTCSTLSGLLWQSQDRLCEAKINRSHTGACFGELPGANLTRELDCFGAAPEVERDAAVRGVQFSFPLQGMQQCQQSLRSSACTSHNTAPASLTAAEPVV